MNEINDEIKKLFESVRKIQMIHTEKKALREVLIHRIKGEALSPYTRFIHSVTHSNITGVVAALLMFMTGSIGYASEKSLPGETLYSVKTDMTERVEKFLILGEKSKAKYEVRLADRRLEEATLLAQSGKLDSETQAKLQTDIKEHVDNASTQAKQLAENKNVSDAQEVSSELEATLVEHSDSLTKIAQSEKVAVTSIATTFDGEAKLATPISSLLANVNAQVQVAKETTSRVEVEAASQADEISTGDTISGDTPALEDIGTDYLDGDPTFEDESAIIDMKPTTTGGPNVTQLPKGDEGVTASTSVSNVNISLPVLPLAPIISEKTKNTLSLPFLKSSKK